MMRLIARASIVLLLAAGLAGTYVWAKLSGKTVPRTTVAELAGTLAPALVIDRPDADRFGPGPYPAILLFHGCAGLTRDGAPRTVTADYARIANEMGVLAVTVDSFGPRGISEQDAIDDVCSGWVLRGAQRAGDVAASLFAVREMPDVDGFRLGLMGWSHGGWALMEALTFDYVKDRPHGITDRYDEALSGVAFVIAAYPHCGFPARTGRRGWPSVIPFIAILVEDDNRTPEEDCLAALERVTSEDGDVTVHMIEGVTHAFDESDLGTDDGRYRYSPEQAAVAHAIFRDAIRAHLLPEADAVEASDAETD